jgi:uncharacterized protein (DUF1499 family)
MVLALAAILLAVAALAVIWVRGNRGAGAASAGALAGLLVLAGPGYFIAQGWNLPPLTDIATEPASPPAFVFAAAERKPGENPLAWPGEQAALAQMSAYPDVTTLRVSQPPEETHALAQQLVEQRGWRVLDSNPATGRIEAVDTSLILRMHNDVVIEIKPDGAGSRVDMRSSARTGRRDFGDNARRIRAFLSELQTAAR